MLGCCEQWAMEDRLTKLIHPTEQEVIDDDAKDQWAALRLLVRPKAVLEHCPWEAQCWDLIFHTVPEWSDMVK